MGQLSIKNQRIRDSEYSRIKAESEAVSNELRQKNIERNAVLADCDRIFKQTTDSRGEFNIVQQRLQKASELKQSIESSLNEQRRQRMLLSDELSHLEEAVHTGRLAKQLADESKEASEDALKNAMNKLDKLQSERKILEEELSSLRISKDNELCYLDERLRTTRQHLESVELELSQKSSKLNEVNEKLNIVQNELISKEQAKSKYEELERELEKLKQHQKYSMGDDENKQTSLSHLFNELETKSSTKTQDNNNNNSSNNNLLQVLMDTKSALIAAQRESKRLKRRTAREVAELERVAEEQCNRAGDLTEQLSLARRHYAQLRSQITTYGILMDEVITIASQTELTEHGKRLEAVLSAVRAELEQHNMVNTLADENDRSGSIIFGQKIHEMLNPEPDSRISQDHLSSDARIQDMAGLNYSSSGLEKSLLLLKNSFHELSHSPSNLYSFQSLTGSLNGLYKKANPFSSGVCPNNHTGHMDEPGTNYTTSGLGSSLNPGTQAESNGSAQENSAILSPSTLVGTKPIGNDWKQKLLYISLILRDILNLVVHDPGLHNQHCSIDEENKF
ncbi:unnamed protein product [Heterobilharzia americana]|nr:unnamed protein product [Heterobilharzia americana]